MVLLKGTMYAKYIKQARVHAHSHTRTESKHISIAVSSQEIWQKVRNEALQILKHAAKAWQVHTAEHVQSPSLRQNSIALYWRNQTSCTHILPLLQ